MGRANQAARAAQKTRTRDVPVADMSTLVDRYRRVLDAAVPGAARWMARQLSTGDATRPQALADPAGRRAARAFVGELLAALDKPHKEARKTLQGRYEAVSRAKNLLLSRFTAKMREVERFYWQLAVLVATARGEGRYHLVPLLPGEVDEDAYAEAGESPAKVRDIERLLEMRNRVNAPHTWVGLMNLPYLGSAYRKYHEDCLRLVETHRMLLVVSLEPEHEEDRFDDLLDDLNTPDCDHLQVASGKNPRVVHYAGQLLARPRRTLPDPGGADIEAREMTIPPALAAMGAICRRDVKVGIHAPPGSLDRHAGSEIFGVERVVEDLTDREVREAFNGNQALNVVFHDPSDGKIRLYGNVVSGARDYRTYGVRRILDAVNVLVRYRLLREKFKHTSDEAVRQDEIRKRLREILRDLVQAKALENGPQVVTVTRHADRQGWRAEVNIRPTMVDTSMVYSIEMIKVAPDSDGAL